MVVARHLAHERVAPQPAPRHLARPFDGKRPLAHVAVAAEEILAGVHVVPVLGDRERRRPLVPAHFIAHRAPRGLIELHHQVLADEARAAVREAVRMAAVRRQQQEARRLDRIARDDDVLRALKAHAAFAHVAHARHAIAARAGFDAERHREIADLGARRERARNPRDERALFRVRRAAADAEAAVHARMREPARRGQRRERRRRPADAERVGAAREHECGRVQLVRAIRIARPLRPPRIANGPADLQRVLHLGVIAPHLAPVERPVRAVAEPRARLEPVGAKAQRHHREMHGAAAHGLAAVVVAERERIVAVAQALVGPVQLALVRLVGGELLERPPPRARVERDDRVAVFGELARERAAARARADDREIHLVLVAVHAHRHPAADAHHVGRAAVGAARARERRVRIVNRHRGSPCAFPVARGGAAKRRRRRRRRRHQHRHGRRRAPRAALPTGRAG
ncbi:Uncharacterised protein [Burkholderia pseudomallei]|nr:Uncharacterised protein [Burkholderia pseudomallei]CAJ3252724.1 Uncharacterised protein [Burkholderia pseudomallei]